MSGGQAAVLLNRNAGRVSDSVARRIEGIVGRDHLFCSRSLEEADSFVAEIVRRGYRTVVCGGGDGTLVRTVNLVRRQLAAGAPQLPMALPAFAALRLGTGNGLAGVVGAGDPLADLRGLVETPSGRVQSLSLIREAEERFLFGGMGYDSQLLHDYNRVAGHKPGWLPSPALQGLPGYLAALIGRTLPRALLRPRSATFGARVVTVGPAWYVDPRRADKLTAVEAGSTLFEGELAVLSVGTTPCLGYGFKMFPFARLMPGTMQLRLATLGPLRAAAHTASLWRGGYRNPKALFDYLVEDVRIELERAFPFQHSGDDQGLRSRLHLQVERDALKLVDLRPHSGAH